MYLFFGDLSAQGDPGRFAVPLAVLPSMTVYHFPSGFGLPGDAPPLWRLWAWPLVSASLVVPPLRLALDGKGLGSWRPGTFFPGPTSFACAVRFDGACSPFINSIRGWKRLLLDNVLLREL